MFGRTMLIGVLILAGIFPFFVFGENIDELKQAISEKNSQIAELEKEIAGFQREIEKASAEASNFKNQIQIINASISKLSRDIKVSQKKIEAAELTIEELNAEIVRREADMSRLKSSLAELLRNINEMENQTVVETLLSNASFSNFFADMDYFENVSAEIEIKLAEIKEIKSGLESETALREKERRNMINLKNELNSRKSVEENARREKNDFLKLTQNKEAEYQRLLSKKEAERAAFESELFELESALRVAIDPSSLPESKKGVLNWPVENPVITQSFGLTDFARAGAYGYDKYGNPKPHLAVDLKAPLYTPVLAASDGVVRGWGNTDAVPRCYSYGKWILIDHPNGLSTMYTHLSQINISKGDKVQAGRLLGYSGNTGYSTAPHLHFAVFARQGVQIINMKEWYQQNGIAPTTACAKGGVVVPAAPVEAYLNPLSYL